MKTTEPKPAMAVRIFNRPAGIQWESWTSYGVANRKKANIIPSHFSLSN